MSVCLFRTPRLRDLDVKESEVVNGTQPPTQPVSWHPLHFCITREHSVPLGAFNKSCHNILGQTFQRLRFPVPCYQYSDQCSITSCTMPSLLVGLISALCHLVGICLPLMLSGGLGRISSQKSGIPIAVTSSGQPTSQDTSFHIIVRRLR